MPTLDYQSPKPRPPKRGRGFQIASGACLALSAVIFVVTRFTFGRMSGDAVNSYVMSGLWVAAFALAGACLAAIALWGDGSGVALSLMVANILGILAGIMRCF